MSDVLTPTPSPESDGHVKGRSALGKLYHGETRIDFVGRAKLWWGLSSAAILLGLVGLFVNGLNLGIEFEGGAVWEAPLGDASVTEAREVLAPLGLGDATIQTLESNGETRLRVATDSAEVGDESVTKALVELTGAPADEVSSTRVGASWGKEITDKAVRALVVFLVLVTAYIALRFEVRMAIPTLVALVHDVLLVIGVYALARFEVTPATVIAVLTILGYSIYDGIVVFDRVDENTRLVSATSGLTYSRMVNLSLNQVLMRSLNTSITALLPVASLLIVGAGLLGADTLQDFALALLIGLAAGAYSSIFVASPLLAVLKEREPRFREVRERVRAHGGDASPVPVAAGVRPAASAAAPVVASGRPIPPRPRKKAKRR